jgi:hypothetical protein
MKKEVFRVILLSAFETARLVPRKVWLQNLSYSLENVVGFSMLRSIELSEEAYKHINAPDFTEFLRRTVVGLGIKTVVKTV